MGLLIQMDSSEPLLIGHMRVLQHLLIVNMSPSQPDKRLYRALSGNLEFSTLEQREKRSPQSGMTKPAKVNGNCADLPRLSATM